MQPYFASDLPSFPFTGSEMNVRYRSPKNLRLVPDIYIIPLHLTLTPTEEPASEHITIDRAEFTHPTRSRPCNAGGGGGVVVAKLKLRARGAKGEKKYNCRGTYAVVTTGGVCHRRTVSGSLICPRPIARLYLIKHARC